MRPLFIASFVVCLSSAWAQVAPPPAPWRGAGPTPCAGPEGGIYSCAPVLKVTAIRAGRLFDSKTGTMLSKQVILLSGDRISDVGPPVKIPAGAEIIDLSRATVLPGLIDAHTHMFNNRGPNGTMEASTLIAIQNASADLRAGFTSARDMSSHGNGYADLAVRDAINMGRIEGPRYQVSTRGIVWGTAPGNPPDNPLTSAVVRSADEARAAVREQIGRGADWIKLFPTGAYSFAANGQADFARRLQRGDERTGNFVFELELALLDRVEGQISRHDFRQRGWMPQIIGVFGVEDLAVRGFKQKSWTSLGRAVLSACEG